MFSTSPTPHLGPLVLRTPAAGIDQRIIRLGWTMHRPVPRHPLRPWSTGVAGPRRHSRPTRYRSHPLDLPIHLLQRTHHHRARQIIGFPRRPESRSTCRTAPSLQAGSSSRRAPPLAVHPITRGSLGPECAASINSDVVPCPAANRGLRYVDLPTPPCPTPRQRSLRPAGSTPCRPSPPS